MNNQTDACGASPMPASKAEMLYNRIQSLQSLIHHGNALKVTLGIPSDTTASPVEEPQQKPQQQPTVALLMTEAAEAISMIEQDVHAIFDTIERELT